MDLQTKERDKKMKKILMRIKEDYYVYKIRKAMKEEVFKKYLALNYYKSQAATDLLAGKISTDFYCNIFKGATMSVHYSEQNAEATKNHKFFLKKLDKISSAWYN